MKSNKKKYSIQNEEDDDYIIDNDQEILDYQNNNNNNISKSNLNKNNKSPKSSNKNQAGNWIKEAKAKYQKERNTNKNNINKTESRISNNNRKPKKIVNFDDIPVGRGMGGGGDFSVEIRVPPKKNNYNQNNSYIENNNIQFRNENNLKKNLDNKTEFNKQKRNNNFFEENNNNNFEPVEMERKNSMISMITQTCDKEMLGRSEFIGIPLNQNSNEIDFSSSKDRLNNNNNKSNYSLYEKQENYSKLSSNNMPMNNYANKITDFSNTQNLREKTESAIQLQNVQRELDNEIEMNKRLQGQIENYKSEFNNLREELVIKSDNINELQQKISKLEKELFLQRNQLIEAEAKPSQEHYEDIINNYENMKKNFDKAIERIKYLSDENAELKERLMRYEENYKKVKKETRYDKDKINIVNDKRNKRIKYIEKQENKDEEEEDNQNEIEEENLYEEQDINPVSKNKKQIEEKNENEEEMPELNKQEKNSIIPEDNDIFGTKNYENRNIRKPRKIQEDGIPVIKRMEERDNVKDIMVNNYAANDDVYYNRPPIGKPKVKRIKRNNNEFDNNLSNFQEQNINTKGSNEFKKINTDYNNDKGEEESKNNDKNDILNENEYNQSKNINIINRRKNNLNNITTNVGVFPSQIKTIENEREILNLESQLFNLQKERDLVNDEYLKYPEYPKKREEINAKRKIEMKLEEMNKEISLQKLKIRELKGKK